MAVPGSHQVTCRGNDHSGNAISSGGSEGCQGGDYEGRAQQWLKSTHLGFGMAGMKPPCLATTRRPQATPRRCCTGADTWLVGGLARRLAALDRLR